MVLVPCHWAAGQVAFQEFTEAANALDVTSIVLPTPAGVSQGDLLIAAVSTDGNTVTSLAAPAGEGWTIIDIGQESSAVTFGVWWKLADAGESPTHTFTWTGGQQVYAWMMRFIGHSPADPIGPFAVSGGNSSTPTCLTVDTTLADSLILRLGGFDDDDITIGSTGLVGHTAITMNGSGTGTSTSSGGAGYVAQAAIGATGSASFALTAGEQYRTMTLALNFGCLVDADCDDGVACTDDTCVSGTCDLKPNDANCNDGNPCNGEETCDAVSDCIAGPCLAETPILNETFDTDSGPFAYLDDTFRGTANPNYSDGTYEATGGETGGGIRTVQGPAPNVEPDQVNMSGGWRTTFNVTGSPASVRFDLSYRLLFAENFETDEYGEALVSVDGLLQGIAPNDYLVRFTGDGNSPPVLDSGWQTHTFTLNLADGQHTLTVGGFLNKTTFDDEDVQSFYDNIRITALAPGTCDCEDSVFCNGSESCSGDVCVPGSDPCPGQLCDEVTDSCVDCLVNADCDDGNFCTDDICNAGTCQNPNNAAACDDGDACTTNDTCSGGACVGGPPPNCDDGNVCTDDSCDSATGCVNTNNVAACDDGDACTTNDTCAAGICVGGAPPNCDDGNVCTDDSCDTATACVNNNNVAACNDGDACTTNDTCAAGACVGGAPPNCDDGNVCTDDSCDPATGCVNTNNVAACDDGDACTTNDTCSAGVCVGGAPPNCDDGNVCTDDSCDPATGCVNTNNVAACDDGDACTTGDTCSAGICVGGTPPDCDDGNICTDDSCDPATGCVNTNNVAACDDGNACTTNDTCSLGTCVGGAPPNCDDGNVCTDDSCDPATGCVNTDNVAACDDGDACTTGDTCSAGICVGGTPPNCDDGNICTDDSCDSLLGCLNTDNAAFCDDGDACTTNDTCSAGICVGGAPPDCDDGNECTDDTCDVVLGCLNTDNVAACDDGDACTTNDTCSAGICVGGAAPDCDDGNPCTDDSCDPVLGCVNTNNTAACDDGDECTTNDTCSAGVCVGGAPPNCDDGNVCTDDSCDPATGCVNTNNAAACDDGDACTTNDTCSAGACVGGAPPNCDDGNVCTDDSCEPATGCVNTNNVASCDDGDACTTNDTCSLGACVGGAPPNCDDGNVCTDDSCDPATGCVTRPAA
jgi:hypothetical protein